MDERPLSSTGSAILERVKRVVELGPRLPGSGPEGECRDLIKGELERIDGAPCETETFNFLKWIPLKQELTKTPNINVPVLQLGYSGVGDVEAELAYCGGGTAEECRNASGKIAICNSGWENSLRFLHRIQKYRNVVRAGAVGFILVGDAGHPPPEGIIRKRKRGAIPAVSLSHDAARKNLGDGKSPVRLSLSVRNSVENNKSENIIWRISGSRPGIALCAHLDSWGTGAWDNASGVALLLQLAEQLTYQNLEHEITLCFTSGEEYGLFGSRDFCARHASEIALAINVDGVGLDGAEIQVRCSDRALAKIPPLKRIYSELPLTPWGDHFSFQAEGIPTLFVTSGSITPVQHTREDSPKILNSEDLAASLTLLREIVAYKDSII